MRYRGLKRKKSCTGDLESFFQTANVSSEKGRLQFCTRTGRIISLSAGFIKYSMSLDEEAEYLERVRQSIILLAPTRKPQLSTMAAERKTAGLRLHQSLRIILFNRRLQRWNAGVVTEATPATHGAIASAIRIIARIATRAAVRRFFKIQSAPLVIDLPNLKFSRETKKPLEE